MKAVTVLILVIGLLVVGIVVPKQADAACAVTIYAERANFSGTALYVYGRVSSTSTQVLYAVNTNTLWHNLILSAVSQRNRLYIVGSGTCPASTPGVFAIGTITSMILNP